MLNLFNQQGNASQNFNEISPHICQDGNDYKRERERSVGEDAEKLKPW